MSIVLHALCAATIVTPQFMCFIYIAYASETIFVFEVAVDSGLYSVRDESQ